MKQTITSSHFQDQSGNPCGGTTSATGLSISWQNGPVESGEPNGAFVETVVEAALDRLQFYQRGKFGSRQNSLAITKLEEALHWLQDRTAERERRGVLNTHTV
jgi:hypothetical protein